MTFSGWLFALSLNCVMRSSRPSGTRVLKIQASSECSGTALCTKTIDRSGSIPAASQPSAMSLIRTGISAGS